MIMRCHRRRTSEHKDSPADPFQRADLRRRHNGSRPWAQRLVRAGPVAKEEALKRRPCQVRVPGWRRLLESGRLSRGSDLSLAE